MTTFEFHEKQPSLGHRRPPLLLNSCDVQPAPEVLYLTVDTLMVAPKTNQGTASSKLTTLWIEQDGEQMGALPLHVPFCRCRR